MAAVAAAARCRISGKGGAQMETGVYRQAAAAAAAAAAPRPRPGKAWRRSEFTKWGVTGAAGNGDGNGVGVGHFPGAVYVGAGGGDGDGDGGLVKGQRRQGWATWDRGGGGSRKGEEESRAFPQDSSPSSSSSSSSSTSGILVRRGLKTEEILADCARHRRRQKLRLPATVSSSGVPLVDVKVPSLLAEDGVTHHVPLGVVAARVQQERYGVRLERSFQECRSTCS